MKEFKSYTQIMSYIFPNKSDFDILGKLLIEHYRGRLRNDNTRGQSLSQRTIDNKIARGASLSNATTKLVEGEGLIDQITKIVTESQLKVGYTSEAHNKVKSSDKTIAVGKLVNIHHNSKRSNLPKRQFLYLEEEERAIVSKWLRDTLRRKTA